MIPRRRADDALIAELALRRRVSPAGAVVDEIVAEAWLGWARQTPGRSVSAAGMADFLLGWFPAHGLLRAEDARRVPGALAALVRLLALRGRVAPAAAHRLLETIRLNRVAFLAAARDSRRWSAAKLALLGGARRPAARVATTRGRASLPRRLPTA